MKNSTFIGILLTLIMVLIVAAATFIFLYPRQQTLIQRTETLTAESDQLRQDLAETGLALSTMDATREAVVAALATAEANAVNLTGELVESDRQTAELQTEQESLTAQLADANTVIVELEIENEQLKMPFPLVTIFDPEDGAVVSPGETIDLFMMAYDPAGITAVNLTLDGETQNLNGNDEPLFTYRQDWQPETEGEYVVSVMAINSNGIASSAVEAAVQVVDIEALNASIRSEIEASVIDLTGLALLEPIEQTLLTRENLAERIESDFAAESSPEEVRRDTLVFSAFDFWAPDYDLRQSLVDLYSDGILGFYDPETAEFVVVSDNAVLGVAEQLTHAHEFVHALQDQHYALDQFQDDNLDAEAGAALRALAEGQATMVQTLLLASGYFTQEDILNAFAGLEGEDLSFLEEAPAVLVASLDFPYSAGLSFAQTLYDQGGMAAIDAAWENPPQSTEQILHVDRYEAGDSPQPVTLPGLTDALGADWLLLEEDTFGEFYLRQYLGQELDADVVELAASGWGGDRYAVYENQVDGGLVMALRLAWDSPADKAEFTAIYPQYVAYLLEPGDEVRQDALVCWPGADEAVVLCQVQLEDDSLIVRAPDLETAVLVAEQFQ